MGPAETMKLLEDTKEHLNTDDGQAAPDLASRASHLQHIGVENDKSERTKITGTTEAV